MALRQPVPRPGAGRDDLGAELVLAEPPRRVVSLVPPPPGPVRPAVVPVWRRPWVVLGPDTFAGDLLCRLGVANRYGDAGAGSGRH